MKEKTLYLRHDEITLFEKIPAKLREGWPVEEEVLQFEDSDKRRKLRVQFMRLHDPALVSFREKVQSAKTEQEATKLIEEADLSAIDERDLFQVLFALGPDAATHLIRDALTTAETDENILTLAVFTQMRHIFLNSLTKSFSA